MRFDKERIESEIRHTQSSPQSACTDPQPQANTSGQIGSPALWMDCSQSCGCNIWMYAGPRPGRSRPGVRTGSTTAHRQTADARSCTWCSSWLRGCKTPPEACSRVVTSPAVANVADAGSSYANRFARGCYGLERLKHFPGIRTQLLHRFDGLEAPRNCAGPAKPPEEPAT
eukprot:3167428-Rhodomonas_salina.1